MQVSTIRRNSLGSFGDFRLYRTGNLFFDRVLQKGLLKINRLSKNRAEQIRFQRFIWNDKVTVKAMEQEIYSHTSFLAKNVEHILAIQDSSELNYQHRCNEIEGLGYIQNKSAIGLCIHPVIAVDAKDNFVLGLSACHMWSWNFEKSPLSYHERDCLPIEEKSSYRWIKSALESKEILSEAKMLTFISDRESDIYQLFCKVPDHKTHVIIRLKADRIIFANNHEDKISNYINHLKVQDKKDVALKRLSHQESKFHSLSQNNERKSRNRVARIAVLELKFGAITLKKPKQIREDLPEQVPDLWVVDVREKENTNDKKPKCADKIHWRIITSHPLNTVNDAWKIVEYYKKRWIIEQYFRAAKKGGLKLEEIESNKAKFIEKMVFIGLSATIKILQLTYCRDENVTRPVENIFNKIEIKLLDLLNKEYQGRTKAQKNPYKKHTMPWAYWIIGRHGGWKGYNSSGPAGPITIKNGLDEFKKMLAGINLLKLVCIT